MANRKSEERQPRDPSVTVTAEDEADILAEVDAERDEATGELRVSEEAMREVGAVDVESVRRNRRLQAIADKKKANVKNVNFNTNDIFDIYDTLLKAWLPDNLIIVVRRLTGSPVTQTITSRPKSGADLYEVIKGIHGQYGEAEYEVKFKDTSRLEYRGTGRIVMPDTRPSPGQPMTSPPAPTQLPTPAAPQNPIEQFGQMFELFQRFSQKDQPAPMPQPSAPSTPFNPIDQFGQMFELFQRFAAQREPSSTQQPFTPPAQPGMDDMMQMFEMFQRFVSQQAPGQPPPPQMPSRSFGGAAPPRGPAPQGMMWAWLPEHGMFAAVPDTTSGSSPAPSRGPYRPPYYPQRDQGAPPYPTHRPQQEQQRPISPAAQFQDALNVVRTAVRAVNEFDALLPGRQGGGFAEPAPEAEENDSPVKVVKTGNVDLVYDRDGNLRGWDSILTNVPGGFKWLGEQWEIIQRTAEERRRQQQPQQRLPPGYVEVGPGYVPPPGFRAVPIDQIPPEDRLPPPPEDLPPPIQTESKRSWGG